MVSYFTILALLGTYIVHTGLYFEELDVNPSTQIEIEPYIYCFITYFLLLYPLQYLNTIDVGSYEIKETHILKVILTSWCILSALYTMIKLSEAAISLQTGLGDAYYARHMEGEVLFEYSGFLYIINHYVGMFHEMTVPIVMFFAYNKLVVKRNWRQWIFLSALCFIPYICKGIGMGSRGALFLVAFCFLFFLFLFKNAVDKKSLKNILVVIISALGLLLVVSWIISVERKGSESDAINHILRYFGESFPNLGYEFWHKEAFHPLGDRFFPSYFVNRTPGYNSFDIYQYWTGVLGVRTYIFKTLFGDLYIEFGTLGAICIMALVSYIMTKYLKRGNLTVASLPLLYFYFQICVYALAGFTKTSAGSILQFETAIVFLVIVNKFIKNEITEQ